MGVKPKASNGRVTKGAKGKTANVIGRKPAFQGWATSDADEIERRQWRGRTEIVSVETLEPEMGYFGTFAVRSDSGGAYDVEVRDLAGRDNSCGCHDFATNGLGTCKHVEGVLHYLGRKAKRAFKAAAKVGSARVEVYPRSHGDGGIHIQWPADLPPVLSPDTIDSLVEALQNGDSGALDELRRMGAQHPDAVRVSRCLDAWQAGRQATTRRTGNREHFLADVEAGRQSLDLLKHPLLPYQVDGMLHLAFGERALLADDMGLGKTVQAVAACELLRRLHGIERVLVVAPASLKAEWQEQIARFTDLTSRIVFGPRGERLKQYRDPAFFTLANYEQIIPDGADINRVLAPDVVILDEAQRIKNWQTKTARVVKGLHSPYAFVLTGTPLENRIDEIYSIVQFLDPKLLGPLFRFNRDYYVLDERGRPQDYKNLDNLGDRLKPVMLRRRKEEVENDLPGRTVSNYFVAMTDEQRLRYEDYQLPVQRLLSMARKRPLLKQEFERLQMLLGCMRMTCDTPYILDSEVRDCPKLEELERILSDLLDDNPQRKIIIFSEWVRMLELVRELAGEMGLEFAWHTGSVPQDRRRIEIERFKKDPNCRLFLSSESGGVGLNLQVADAVINLDLPWNPAKLEQRIARAWRKYQTRPVSVVNLIAEDSIEHRMLYLLEQKQGVADGVLDGLGDLKSIRMPSGRGAFLERMEAMMADSTPPEAEAPDPASRLRDDLLERHGEGLLSLVSPDDGPLIAVIEGNQDILQGERQRLTEIADLAVEVMDRQTFETIRRLEVSGVLRFTGGEMRELHRSPRLDDDGKTARLEEARQLAAEADRKLRMASLLAGGGFEAESRTPAGEALEIALRSLTVAAGMSDPRDDARSDDLLDTLSEGDLLPLELKRGIEATQESEAILGVAGNLLSHVRGFLEDITGST
jgi:hypothetical protein